MLAATFPAATPAQLRASETLARLLRNARAAQQGNPRTAGLYPGPVTVTDAGATLPAATPQAFLLSPTSRGIFHVIGGLVSSLSNDILASSQNAGTRITTMARVEAMTNSRYVAVKVRPSTKPYRFLVDGRFISMEGLALATQTGSTPQYILLDFGTRAVRRLTVDLSVNSSVYGFLVEGSATAWPVDLSDAVHGVMLGDSYVAGTGPTIAADGIAFQLGDRLGFHIHASGVGGTGWTTGGATYNFGQRIDAGDLELATANPDILFLMTSYNDRTAAAPAMQAAVGAGLAAARARHPDVPIILFGCAPGATGPSGGILTTEQAAQAAVVASRDPLVHFIPFSTDGAGAWISGTGTIAATTGTGSSDWATASDGVHPSDEGASFLGRRYAEGTLLALTAMYGS